MNNGYNPMHWNCEKQGCFNKKCRPKIEVFYDCFPRNISFGDVDGIIEINGSGLMLEWKCFYPKLKTAQKRMYENLTKTGLISVIVIFGDAETMVVKKHCWFMMGRQGDWIESNLYKVKEEIKAWIKYFARIGSQNE